VLPVAKTQSVHAECEEMPEVAGEGQRRAKGGGLMGDIPEIVRSYVDVRHAKLAYKSHLTQMPQWQLDELKNFMLSNGYREEEFPHPNVNICRMRYDEKDTSWVVFPRRVGDGSEETVDFVLRHLEARKVF
jgi:hypothetical protein